MAEKIATAPQQAPGFTGGRGEKSKNMKKAHADFFRYLGKHRWSMLAAALFSVAGAISFGTIVAFVLYFTTRPALPTNSSTGSAPLRG